MKEEVKKVEDELPLEDVLKVKRDPSKITDTY